MCDSCLLQEKYEEEQAEKGKPHTPLKKYMHIYLSKRFGLQVPS